VKTAGGGSIAADASNFTIGRISNTNAGYFKGYVDEVRVFNKALTENELQKIVYQEIEDNSGTIMGSVVKLNVDNFDAATQTSTDLPWNNLQYYFNMDTYKHNIVDDLSTATVDVISGAKMYNIKNIKVQTAPLPFVTQSAGTVTTPKNLTDALNTAEGVYGVDAIASPASIVKIEHNYIYSNEDQKHVALFVSSGNEYSISGTTNADGTGTGNKLEVSRYLYLNGAIDLQGESQLVQGGESILDANSGGFIERDQQGTANGFNYNYWSSPVGEINTMAGALPLFTKSTNGNYVISKNLLDGSQIDGTVVGSITYPCAIDYGTSYKWADSNSYTGARKISTYWLYTFYGTADDYWSWAPINQNTPLAPGKGYTMKGTTGDVALATRQNYVFKGKPNNGEITLPIDNSTKEVEHLVGNPYPSAIDANKFILDHINVKIDGQSETGSSTVGNVFNGALYFWDHFGQVNSHYLREYVGGYATYTLMGGTKAISEDSRINHNGSSGDKIPGRYIPVGQGFFVMTTLDLDEDDNDKELTGTIPKGTEVSGGTITFKNSQRVFIKESDDDGSVDQKPVSVFMKSEKQKETASSAKIIEDVRPKIRLMFSSPKGYHRQLLIGVDENASNNFDLGYDGVIIDIGSEDMYWKAQGAKLVIQAVPNFNVDQEFPLELKIAQTGVATIKVDVLENVDASTDIYIKDALTGKTTKINNEPFQVTLDAGTYTNRFSLTFAPQNTLAVAEDILEQGLLVFMNNITSELQIKNTIQAQITKVYLYNSLGQLQQTWTKNLENLVNTLPIIHKATGMYLVQITTTTGVMSKKVIID
jgi:hypothetical protein